MKIAIVIENFDPSGGGNERSTDQIARRLVARGHQLTVLCATATAQLPGGRVLPRGARLGTRTAAGLIGFARWARQQIHGGGFDVSLSMTTAVAADVLQPRGGAVRETLARNIAMRRGELRQKLKLASIAASPKRLALLALETQTFRSPAVKKIVAISAYVADQLFHHYALSSRLVELIPNAAEIQPMNPVDRHLIRTRLRAALRLDPENVAFLFAARNLSLKGLPQLLEAFACLRASAPAARLLVAGALDYHATRPVDRLGLCDTVRWVGPTRRMDALYATADVTVLPTWYDPSSKVVLESLLHGVPAISTLYNGASQWILSPTGRSKIPSPFEAPPGLSLIGDPQPAGRVIAQPGDIDALCRAMLDLCDPQERQRCAAATIGLHNHITMDRHVDRLEAVLAQHAH